MRVLNHVFYRSWCRPYSSSRWLGRPTPWLEPSGSVTQYCSSLRLLWRALPAARAGDIDEMDRCIEIHESLAEQLDQPFMNWIVHLQACPASDDRRGYRPGRTTGHRGPPDRHRQRPARRRPRLRHTTHDRELPTRNPGRDGPAHRAGGGRQSRAPGNSSGADPGLRTRRPHRRRASFCWRDSRPPTSSFLWTGVAHRNGRLC